MDNSFYDVVGEETWTLRLFHRKIINSFKPDVNQNAEFELENA